MSFPTTPTVQGAYRGAAVTRTTANSFIPTIWSDEVQRARDAKFIASTYTKRLNFRGRSGDRLHIPIIGRAAVNRKLPESPVTLQARTETEFFLDITQYKESSFMIEDVVKVQAAHDIRSEYTREAGYALARDMDNYVLGYRAALNNFPAQRIFNTVDGTAAGSASNPLNQAAILAAKEILDLKDVPQEGRVLIVGWQQYNDLLTIDQFINFDFIPSSQASPTASGKVGMLYGYPVIATTQIGVNSATGYVNGANGVPEPTPGVTGSPYLPDQDAFTALPTTIGNDAAPAISALLVHNDWLAMGVQIEPRAESSRETLYLADVVVMSQLYGAKLYRADHGVVIHSR